MAPARQADTLAAATTLVAANGVGRSALVDNLTAQVRALLELFTQWYSDPAVTAMSREVAGIVVPTQQQMVAQENAYLSEISSLLSDRTVKPARLAPVEDLRTGVTPDEVYERIARQYRYELSQGVDEHVALEHVLTRADVMNQMDVALAARRQDAEFFTEHHITGYRRVIHPELAKGGTCGLCIAASDRVYKRDRLLPIHDRCHCGVMPILGGFDAGSALNTLDLGDLYEAAGSTGSADLKRVRYAVDEHGELGPTLVPKKGDGHPQTFSRSSKPPSLVGLDAVTQDWLQHQIGLTEGLKASDWRTAQLARLRAALAERS